MALQEAAQVLASQAAQAFERIVLSNEIDRRNSEAYFRALVVNAADVIIIVDEANRIRYASPSAAALFGVAQLAGVALSDLVHPDDVAEVHRRLDVVRAGGADHHDEDWRVSRRLGDRLALVEADCRDLRDEPTVNGLVVTLRDVTEGRRLQAELFQRATFDSLTGLPNREAFLVNAQRAVEEAAAAGATAGVLLVEFDDFKVVNDTLGHAAGDELLVEVGRLLTDALAPYERPSPSDGQPDGVVARLGGDEYAVIVRHARTPADVERVAGQIMEVFTRKFTLSHGEVGAAASVGVATTAEASDAQELLRHADLAVYVAKDDGKARVVRYESELHTVVVERLRLRTDLDRAVADEAFLLHYQPIVALGSGHTMGFEALVRWNHPVRGMVSPLQFIEIAEESGLIVPLGTWVLHNAIQAAAKWRRLRPTDSPYVSVNVSARQFRVPGFVDLVRQELAAAGLPPQLLLLEITESVVLRGDGSIGDDLNALREDGSVLRSTISAPDTRR